MFGEGLRGGGADTAPGQQPRPGAALVKSPVSLPRSSSDAGFAPALLVATPTAAAATPGGGELYFPSGRADAADGGSRGCRDSMGEPPDAGSSCASPTGSAVLVRLETPGGAESGAGPASFAFPVAPTLPLSARAHTQQHRARDGEYPEAEGGAGGGGPLPDIPPGLRATAQRSLEEAFDVIASGLTSLVKEHESAVRMLRPWSRPVLGEWLRSHGLLSIAACAAFVVSFVFSPTFDTASCAVVSAGFLGLFSVVEIAFVWARSVELRSRCLRAITVHLRSGFATGEMLGLRGIAGVRALRAQRVLRRGTLQLLPKALLLKDDVVLNERAAKYEREQSSSGAAKLLDCLAYALTREAGLLPRLTSVPKPPRFPNLCQNFEEEEDESSDASDDEDHIDVRSTVPGGTVPTVTMAMEWCTHRLLLLVCMALVVPLLLLGGLRGHFLGYAVEELLFFPVVALLGFVPLNAFLLNRVLVLFANAALYNSIDFLKRQKSMYSFLTRDENVPIGIRQTFIRALRCLRMDNLDKPLCFARSSVETLGFLTVLAPLDFEGILTDIIPVPVAVLFINRSEGSSSSSSSDDDDVNSAVLSEEKIEERRERRRQLRLQVRRAKFQQRRFTQLEMTSSGDPHFPTEFLNDDVVTRNRPGLNPLCLCVVLHSVLSRQYRADGASATQRSLDKTVVWARCCHWMSRAAGFADTAALRYTLLMRVHSVRTFTHPLRTEQVCGLLVTPDGGETLHLFALGSAGMVVRACSSYWTGTEIEEFDEHEKDELLTVGLEQWERGRTFECVACAHRVLPRRYSKYLLPVALRKPPTSPTARCGSGGAQADARGPASPTVTEHYLRDGVAVEEIVEKVNRRAHMRRGEFLRHHRRSNSSELPRRAHFAESTARPALRRTSNQRRASFGDVPRTAQYETDEVLSQSNAVNMMMTCNATFLGLIGLRDFTRPNVESAVSMLAEAGIRLTHFGHSTEAHTKAFGSRLGLETDFNSCVSLKDEFVALDPKSIRAQLPYGVKSIRRHLVYVDHIPLQVSLFSHSRSASTRSMVSILQDNHEVVCVLGSGINHSHMRSFIQADVAIATTPTTLGSILERADIVNRTGEEPWIDLSHHATGRNLRALADLFGSVCAMKLPPTANALPMLTVIIRESRLLMKAVSNAVEFTLHGGCCVALLHLAALPLGVPMLVSPTATLWVLNFTIPLIASGCTYTNKHAVPVMKVMPNKHSTQVRLKIFAHSTKRFFAAYVPTIIVLLIVGIASLCHTTEMPLRRVVWGRTDSFEVADLALTRAFVLLLTTYYFGVHALCHVSRHQRVVLFTRHPSPRCYALVRCFRWMLVTLLAMLSSLAFAVASTDREIARRSVAPVVVVVLSVLYPALIVALDYPLKRYRTRRFTDIQKFRRLFFQTRLGMHSPKGDYEPSEGSNESDTRHLDQEGGGGDADHGGGGGGGGGVRQRPWTVGAELRRFLWRWVAIQGGRMEQNSVVVEDHPLH